MIVTVCMIQICEYMEVKLNVIGVYLPYWNNTKEQTELYIETLDMIQALIDSHCQTAKYINKKAVNCKSLNV